MKFNEQYFSFCAFYFAVQSGPPNFFDPKATEQFFLFANKGVGIFLLTFYLWGFEKWKIY